MRALTRLFVSAPLAGRLGRRRQQGVDAALDPQIAVLLELQRRGRYRQLETLPPAQARRYFARSLAPMEVPPAPLARVVDTEVPGPAGPLPVRLYVPTGAGPHWLVYFHGGGGVIGSIETAEPFARLLAAQTGCTVASVEYRLGPEHPHPAAIDDACAAWDALVAQVPAGGKAGVGGDSFGGFLASHVDLHGRRAGNRPPDLQLLIYPVADMTLSAPSITRLGEGYLLSQALIRWFLDHYFAPTDDRIAPSPAHWADHAGAAPAIVVTAGYDPLVDDGDALAAQLAAAGVPVRHRRHPGLIHGFTSVAGVVTSARRAIDEMCADVIAVLAS